jgi:hypothetical protein
MPRCHSCTTTPSVHGANSPQQRTSLVAAVRVPCAARAALLRVAALVASVAPPRRADRLPLVHDASAAPPEAQLKWRTGGTHLRVPTLLGAFARWEAPWTTTMRAWRRMRASRTTRRPSRRRVRSAGVFARAPRAHPRSCVAQEDSWQVISSYFEAKGLVRQQLVRGSQRVCLFGCERAGSLTAGSAVAQFAGLVRRVHPKHHAGDRGCVSAAASATRAALRRMCLAALGLALFRPPGPPAGAR